MSKNVSDNNNAAMLLMSHVRDVIYINKRSKATLYRANVTHVGDIGDVKYLNAM